MFETIYIEESVLEFPSVQKIISNFPAATRIQCQRYTEIFNRKAQNFRLQKKKPALILANKFNNFVLPVPDGYGIGARHNYYFSHMLNCVYDCRYCFLQGMYRSANYVLFVNFEDFESSMKQKIDSLPGEEVHFFSGYDCDSLAFEPLTHFAEFFLPFFKDNVSASLELRTKSTQIRSLLNTKAIENCIVAFSLTPDEIAKTVEHKAPTIERRLEAMSKLQDKGWNIGLRFDPLIFQSNYREIYEQLFNQVFSHLEQSKIHSVSLGSFRLPKNYFQTLSRLYPDEKLFASPLEESKGMISYKKSLQMDLHTFCSNKILQFIPKEKFYSYEN
jgi:spore photoproduct lyase